MVQTHRVTVAGTGQSFDVCEGDRILATARRAGIWFPFECGWGGCGTCKATVVEGETELLFAAAPAVDPRDTRRRRILVCQSTPTSDIVVKPLRTSDCAPEERPTRDYRASLRSREELARNIGRFRFSLDDVATYRPGQHAILSLAPGLRRCYSMAGLPGSREVEFIAKRYDPGTGSQHLFQLPIGTQIDIELPYGDTWLRPTQRPIVLIAGGTGISAILSLVRQLATGVSEHRPVHVFYGAATRKDLACWDELSQAMALIPDAHLHTALLEPDAHWHGDTGLVTTALAQRLPDLADAEVYLAGPPLMVDAVRAQLHEHDVQADRIHYDSFG